MKGAGTSLTGPAGRLPCRSLSPGDKFSNILLDVAIWRGLLALGEPVRRLLALLLFLARSGATLAGDLKRGLWQALGWLSAPPRTPAIRQLGLNLAGARRWHYAVGESWATQPVTSELRTCSSVLTSFQCALQQAWSSGLQSVKSVGAFARPQTPGCCS